MRKRALSLLLALTLCLGLLVIPAGAAGISRTRSYTAGMFTDVAADAWYATSVKDAYELGLMSGNSADTFNPTGMFTLGEAATIAARMHSLYNGGDGTIAPAGWGQWYQGAVDYCYWNGIFSTDAFSDFSRNATRAEMAGIIAAALPDAAWSAINSVSALPDVYQGADSSTPYAEAIFKLYNAGVFTGSDEYGQFQPYAAITRAEVAAIVARCADAQLRKTLSLTPLSQRQAPEIPGTEFGKMSCGRLRFKDPDTKKWGFVDGNGNVVIPAQYGDYVENFWKGHATVEKDGKQGVIDINGNVVLPFAYNGIILTADGWGMVNINSRGKETMVYNWKPVAPGSYIFEDLLNHMHFLARPDNRSKYGVMDLNGNWCTPSHYDGGDYNGYYYILRQADEPYGQDVYDDSFQLLLSADRGSLSHVKDNPLLSLQDGNKVALVVGGQRITEAIYDSIDLVEDSQFAVGRYGDQRCLLGVNGVVPGAELGKYNKFLAVGDLAIGVSGQDNQLFDTAGALATPQQLSGLDDSSGFIQKYDGVYLAGLNSKPEVVFDKTGNVIFDFEAFSKEHDGYSWSKRDPSEPLIGKDGTKVYVTAAGVVPCVESEAPKVYWQSTENGKPVLYYGIKDDKENSTLVIQYYKNNMYYDEIQDVGEGYFVCRFNTTHYLVHP